MRLEIYDTEIPRVFSGFSELVGSQHWVRRAKLVKEEMCGKPLLRSLLQEENEFALGFAHFSEVQKKFGQLPPNIIESAS